MNTNLKKLFRKAMALAIAGTMMVGSVVTTQAAGLRDVFDMSVYSNYEDLTTAFGSNETAMYNHYVTYGLSENRVMTELIDVQKYRAEYPDLDAAFGDNWDAYVNHYLTFGFEEGRKSFGKFDARAYADRYPDLKEAFGYDVLALYRHYMEFGRNEGRCAETYAYVAPAASSSNNNQSGSTVQPENPGTQNPEGPAVEVTGRLVDPETGLAIPNATVTARPVGTAIAAIAATVTDPDEETVTDPDQDDETVTDGDQGEYTFTTTTDENGNYVLNVPAGTYTLTATAAGYMVLTMDTVVVNAGEAAVVPTITLLSESADGESRITGRLTNAFDGTAIEGVTVTLRGNWNNYTGVVVATTTTDANGQYTFNVDRGYYTATYTKDGFVEKSQNVICLSSTTSYVQNEALTPVLAESDSYRVVLTWGETPRDLDSHITGPTEDGSGVFHVYYGNKRYYVADETTENGVRDVVTLDFDDTSSYGPETVTVITPQDNAIYRYSVHQFSSAGSLTTSNAQVAVYAGSSLVATYSVPVTGEGRYWNVFEIRDGEIVTINEIQANGSEAQYAEDLYTE